MRETHRKADFLYEQIRKDALLVAQKLLKQESGIRFTTITENALLLSKEWQSHPDRRVDWDWFAGYGDLSFRYPKRFELAIWHFDRLVSLSFGRPTYRGGALRLDFFEVTPEGWQNRAMPLVLLAMRIYARAIGAKEIRFVNPINDTVKSYYEKSGMTYVKHGDFLFLKVEG